MRPCTAFLLFFMLVPLACAASESMEIYIRNRPLSGAAIVRDREIYVPASQFRTLIREDLAWDESTGLLSIRGQATSIRIIKSGNTVYLPLKAASSALGYDTAFNKSTGIIDVYKKVALKKDPPQQNSSPAAAASAQSGTTEQKKDLLTIEEKGAMTDRTSASGSAATASAAAGNSSTAAYNSSEQVVTSPGAGTHGSATSARTETGIRIYAEVTNGRSTEARNVVATCTLKTGDGAVYTSQNQPVGTMRVGEKSEVIFYFPSAGGGVPLNHEFSVKGE